MERAIVVTGTLSDPTYIELDEPVTEIQGTVEIVVRRVGETLLTVIFRQTNYQVWAVASDAWVEEHDRTVPLPCPFLTIALTAGVPRQLTSLHFFAIAPHGVRELRKLF